MDQDPLHDDQVIRPARLEVLDSLGNPLEPRRKARASSRIGLAGIPPVSASLLGLMALVFVIFNVALGREPLELAFSPIQGKVFPQILTHIFAHASFVHLLGNALAVLFLGTMVERLYGPWRYLLIFFASGIIAALVQAAAMPEIAMIGASGATSAIIAVFARHFPQVRLYIWGLLPVPAWLLLVGWVGYNLIAPWIWPSSPIAYTAHLGGIAAGFVLSLLMMPPKRARRLGI